MTTSILNKIVTNFFLIVCVLMLNSCFKEGIHHSDLIVKNNLLYKGDSKIPFTGHEKARVNENIIEYDVKDGYKHGEFKLYDLDENLVMQGQLDSNRNVGKWQYFYSDGKIESEGNFYYDHPDGKWTWYYSDGKIREEGYFDRGTRTGIWYQYTTEGKVFTQKNYNADSLANTSVDSLNEKQN
jgi:antitoxin component YwqK of YwqJK toxin-antitoxin module